MNKNFVIIVGAVLLLFSGGFFYRYRSNAADERGATRLMRSFEQETDEQAQLRLIRRANDINEQDRYGRTALFYALRHDADPQMVRHLLRVGADVNIKEATGQTVLMWAARYSSSPDVLQQLLTAGAQVNEASREGYTALMLACQFNKPEMVKVLVRAGADCDLKNENGKTAGAFLAENKRFSEVEKADFLLAFKVLSIIGPRPAVVDK